MLTDSKNIKDSQQKSLTSGVGIQNISVSVSYTKTNKLVTAVYMVTDMIDKNEPIRNKLRILGTEIISDMHSNPTDAVSKISEAVSFLNIASAMNLVSEMNCAILKQEFLKLKESIQEYVDMKPKLLGDFFLHSQPNLEESIFQKASPEKTKPIFVEQNEPIVEHKILTRIGVQKGSTLMKALRGIEVSDKTSFVSDKKDDFNILKNKRREEIIKVIRNYSNNNGLTITEIKKSAKDFFDRLGLKVLVLCSEKTLQRELIAMVKDGVLYKTGEKRWSKYFVK